MKNNHILVAKNEIVSGRPDDTLVVEMNSSLCFALYWSAESRSLLGHCSPEVNEDQTEEQVEEKTDDIGEMLFSLLKKTKIPDSRRHELKIYLLHDHLINAELIKQAKEKLTNERLDFLVIESFEHEIHKFFFHCSDGTTSLELRKKPGTGN